MTSWRFSLIHLFSCLLFCVQIGLVCEVPAEGSLTDAVSHEGGIYLTDVFMNGASWDVEKGALTKAGYVLHSIKVFPSVFLVNICLIFSDNVMKSAELYLSHSALSNGNRHMTQGLS